MKKIIITITLFVLSVIVKGQWAEYKATTLYTPTGVSIDALIFDDENNEDFDEEEVIAQNDDWTEGYNCEILADATKYYNCHGYAWHNIEGNMAQVDLRQIVDRDPYGGNLYIVEKYFTGDDPAYKLLPDPKYEEGVKIFFGPNTDHSAVASGDGNYLISKWSYGPLVKHTAAQCPWYPNSVLTFYELNPTMEEESTGNLCYNVERDYNTNITHMVEGTLSWTKGNNLTVNGEDDEPDFTVKGGSSFGWSYVKLEIETPSGFTWESTKNFWTGVFNQTWVSGWPSVCPNITYTYTALVPGGHDPSYSYSWTYPYGWIYISQDENEIDLRTTSTPIGGTVRVSITNECGSSNYSGITVYPGSCYYYYMMYPNPASEEITISIIKPETIIFEDIEISDVEVAKDISTDQDTYTIRIYNNMGILILSATRLGTSFNIPLPNLRDGTYVVEVSDGKNSYREQLIIKHE